MKELKILFTGPMGAGKTTAISMISDVPPIVTDVPNNDPESAKALTTVGLDYGELQLATGEQLRLYGTPGQRRFEFMWRILANGALGLVILLDHTRPDPIADLAIYLTNFSELIKEAGCVVAVGRLDGQSAHQLEPYIDCAQQHHVVCPVVAIDVRDRDQVLLLMDLLLLQLESRMDIA